jgi:hypothetical protein
MGKISVEIKKLFKKKIKKKTYIFTIYYIMIFNKKIIF